MTQNSIPRSWVASANGHSDFPLQNLPLGVFSLNGSTPRAGVAIGEHIFDCRQLIRCLFVGKGRFEFFEEPVAPRKRMTYCQLSRGVDGE